MFLHTCLYEEWKSIPLNVSCLFTILQIAAATGKSKCLHSNLSSINQNHYCQVLEECHLFQWKRKGQMMLSTWKKERFCWQSRESCASISAFLKVMSSSWCWVEVIFKTGKVLVQPWTRIVYQYKSNTKETCLSAAIHVHKGFMKMWNSCLIFTFRSLLDEKFWWKDGLLKHSGNMLHNWQRKV